MDKRIEQLIDGMADDLRSTVETIEARPVATTKDHYGEYLALIGVFEDKYKAVVALALTRAGANDAGVTAALKLSM